MGLILVTAVIVAAVAAGAALERRSGARAEALADRLLSFSLFGLLPIVVFFNVVRLDFTGERALGLALAWVALLSAGALAYLVARRRFPRPVVGTVIVAVLAANTGYLGYPITAVFRGRDRLPEAIAYDILVAVPMLVFVCFAIGAAFGSEAGGDRRARTRAFVTRNPLLPAFALALVVPDALAPALLVDLSQALVFALLPVGFFAVGVYLAATSATTFSLPRPGPEVALAIGLRLVVAPSLLFLLALPLIDLPAPYLILAAMPCGLNTLIVANAFGLDRRLAAGTIAWSTLVALAAAVVLALAGA